MNILKVATYSMDTRWFTAVMATIMVASISSLHGFETIVPYFFVTSLIIFFSIIIFKTTQIALFYENSLNELLNPEKSFYFFTIVSAINLIGICLSKVFHFSTAAYILWYVAISLWLGVSFSSFSILFLHRKSEDRKIEDILHGGWFFTIVGTQSTAFIGITVAEHAMQHVTFIQLFSFVLWSVGACLYLIFTVFIMLRLVFYQLSSDAALSPYWMNMGAAALTALTGIALYQHIHIMHGPFTDFLPFLKGFSLFFWSVGLWWLPFLVILAIRKQAFCDDGLVFTVGYWEVAFALGLYAYGTIQLSNLFGGQYLIIISICFSIACIALWCFASVFTLIHLVKSSIWVPVNDLTINYAVPYSFKLRGRIFRIREVVNEWVDQTIQGVSKKRYCVVISDNLTCQISYNMLTKKWYFDRVIGR
ncbi:MAG: tellurite resistance/C4-dicarboxylate transporter family protein [Candidatus Jettenia sp. CY-1]|nr:MAG: tellurite resistance/C4-dicarboxylate transporter family protein [Candidatus Jettenia sp. CY-1]